MRIADLISEKILSEDDKVQRMFNLSHKFRNIWNGLQTNDSNEDVLNIILDLCEDIFMLTSANDTLTHDINQSIQTHAVQVEQFKNNIPVE